MVVQGVGITAGYLPGLSVRRIADLAPGSARADAKDAVVIAGAARTLPHTLRSVSTSDEDAAALSMLTGFRPGPGSSGQPERGPDPGSVVHPDLAPLWRRSWRRWWGRGRAHDAPRSQRADVVARIETLAPGPPSMWPGPDRPVLGSGPDRRRPCWPRPRGKTSTTGAQPASRIRPGAGDQEIGLIDPR